MKRKSAIIFSVAISLLVVLALFALPAIPDQVNAQEGEIENGAVVGWMWSSNIGWIRADSNSINPVMVDPETGEWSGYAWSSSLGWIDFGPSGPYPQAPEHGVKTEENQITGWARSCSVFVSGCSGTLKPDSARGSWDGWIKMVNVVRDPETGGLNGFAWGSLNLGWLSFGVHADPPGGGCTLDPVDTNCDGTTDCDPCVQTCVPSCGGGGPSVTCTVEPTRTSVGENVTYTSIVTGAMANTYNWSSGSNPEDPSDLGTNTPGEDSTFVTSYPSVGTYYVKVEAFDEDDTSLGSALCNGETGVTIDPPCVPDGDSVPTNPPLECCNPDTDGDGLCGSCQITINDNDDYGIELYFDELTPRYVIGENSFYRSATNQKITLAGGCSNIDITADSLPSEVYLICSPISETEAWGPCTSLAQGDYWVGVYSSAKPEGVVCQDINLSALVGSVQTEVCFTGSAGN